MKRLLYSPLQGLLWLMARMPLWMLYAIADVIYLVIYRIAGYRRRVVRQQLSESFPEKSPAQIKEIERRFYHNFADLIVETIKLGHISDKAIKRRVTFEGVEIVDRLMSEGKSVVAYFSHTGNWEWTPSITLWSRLTPHRDAEFCQVYRQLRNPWFDALMLRLRSRFEPLSFEKRVVLRDLIQLRRRDMPSITGFMSDQKPSHGDPTRVLMFLNKPTAFITGTEVLARKLKMAVVYWDMHKVKRGHYRVVIRLLTDDASRLPEMALTDTYSYLLERTIRRDPAIWLWTHKRWKHPVNADPSEPILINGCLNEA